MNTGKNIAIVILLALAIALTAKMALITKELNLEKNKEIENIKITNNNVRMSNKLNKAMYEAKDYAEMKEVFDKYEEKIGKETFNNYFDVKNRNVAVLYYLTDSRVEYEKIDEVVGSHNDSKINVYIFYRLYIYSEGEGIEEETCREITGVNKYTFVKGKLVSFSRLY